jgi:hypothetical protein
MTPEEKIEALREELELWKTLQSHPMWERYEAFLREQASLRRDTVEYSLKKMEDLPAHFQMLGEVNGLGIAAEYPGRCVADAKQELADTLKLMEVRDGE